MKDNAEVRSAVQIVVTLLPESFYCRHHKFNSDKALSNRFLPP